MTIAGKSITLTFHGRITNQGTIAVRTALDGKYVNLRVGDDQFWPGRYELDGDHLRLCFDEAGKGKPKSVAPEGTQWAEHWRRVKP